VRRTPLTTASLAARNQFVFSLLPLAVLMHILLAGILFWEVSSLAVPNTKIWLLALGVVTFYRIVLGILYHTKRISDQVVIRQAYFIGIIFTGAIWGSSAVFLGHVGFPEKMTILLILTGIAAGGISVAISSFSVFFVYAFLCISPVFFWLVTQEESTYQLTSITTILYLFMLSMVALHSLRFYNRTLALKEEKEELVQTLSNANTKLKEANQAKSDFLSHFSHEIRTPMNSILGFTELLEAEEQLSEKYKDKVRYIHQSGHHLLDLLNDVLDLSVIDSGQVKLESQAADIREIAKDCESILTGLANKHQVGLDFQYNYKGDFQPRLDAKRIRQILTNLISNSIKYNRPNGKVWVSFNKENNGDFSFTVKDNGLGIAPEQICNIYEEFNRAGREKSDTEGTGIGLTIVKRLIDRMNGSIEVHSEENRGTMFMVTVPTNTNVLANNQNTNVAVVSDEENSAIPATSANIQILIVEDNRQNQIVLRAQLGKLGYEVDCVSNGKDAIAKLKTKSYSLIVTDCNMPEMDGYEMTKQIRNQEKMTGQHCPIIAITADAYETSRERCYEVGMDEFLTKPVDYNTLKKTISRWAC